MTSKTAVFWPGPFTAENEIKRDTQLNICISQGLTDGTVKMPEHERTWVSHEAAADWVAFVNTFDPPPTSATVTDL